MQRKNIGVRADDFRMDLRRALRCASEMAFRAVEVSADGGGADGAGGFRAGASPDALSQSGRRHLAKLVRSQGLAFASLASEATGRGVADPAQVDRVVEGTGAVLQLAADMQVPIVSHDVGDLAGLSDSRLDGVVGALRALAEQAQRVGTVYAIRSRVCSPEALDALVKKVDCPLVKISVDPASLLMAGYSADEALGVYGERLVLAYVRDATGGTPEHPGFETGLGEGCLDVAAYLAGVAACGCGGAPILRRAQSAVPVADIAADRDNLERHLPR